MTASSSPRSSPERKIEGGDVEGWVRRKQAPDRRPCWPTRPGSTRGWRSWSVGSPGASAWGSSRRPGARISTVVLAASGLADAFEVIVGKEDVAAVKPDPEGYVLALNGCGCRPERRSPSRTRRRASRPPEAAGLRAIAVGHRKPLGEWVGPSDYVPDLTEASNLIGLLGLA